MEKLLNKKEIAEVLGVSVKAIDKWVCERRIPFIKLSQKCVRFVPSQMRMYLNKFRIKPVKPIPVLSRQKAKPPVRPMSRPKPRR
ncbi:helix-turn-helix transcriptional regulator [Dinghuibacter silviterrae]|uniref:Excisionase family DNA binding protein n=1 Tax=Dinghuibacter silviterrae TaxID=1539049 RepID=A0A4R8DG38_9BACT|nr:helix-turn-helix domain-containing protein [Dinghuibacter silviterrae]TDW96417.1 excisionase family DNA binding protein [Dinghuibacter silviterrae]